TRAIRNAQEKVEAHNFDIRKHLLEYDDVLNKQREVIYARRRELLSEEDLGETAHEMAEGLAEELVAAHCSDEVASDEWDLKTLDGAVFAQFTLRLNLPELAAGMTRSAEVEELVVERVRQAYTERETAFTPPVMRHLERIIWLQTLDTLWRGHPLSMDHLKEGIGARGDCQKKPPPEDQKGGDQLFWEPLAPTAGGGARPAAQPARGAAPPGAAAGLGAGALQPADARRRRRHAATPAGAGGESGAVVARRCADRAAEGGDRPARRREGRTKRPLPLRQRQEVQEVPRGRVIPAPARGDAALPRFSGPRA